MVIKTKLKKFSTNQYFGNWKKRKPLKDNLEAHFRIDNIGFKKIARPIKQVDYIFHLKPTLLDVTNCSGMIKVLEDLIFYRDDPDYIKKVTIEVRLTEKEYEYVEITIQE